MIYRVIAVLFWVSTAFAGNYPVIIDHDGGVDDILATAAIIANPKITTRAILVTPADSWLAPSLDITRSLVRKMKLKNITIAAGKHQGKNPFPALWRNDSYKMMTISTLLPSLSLEEDSYVDKTPAIQALIKLLSDKTQYDLLITGPMTNLAKALSQKPAIAKNIHRVYFMGGAFQTQGNVNLKHKPRYAEWNIYNQPSAINTVLSHHVPVVFVPLDATNKAPVTAQFMNKLIQQKHYQLSTLAHQLLTVISPQIGHGDYQKRYFFWDVLTAAALIDESVIKIKPITTKVITKGKREGQTRLSRQGYAAFMAYDVDRQKLESLLLKSYQHNFPTQHKAQ